MVTGSEALWDLGTRYRNIGDVALQHEVHDAINKALRGTESEIKQQAMAQLPRRGGFAAWVANAPVLIRTAKNTAGKGGRRAHSFGAWIIHGPRQHDFAAIDRGRLRHPVFGRREETADWQTQEIPRGYFTLTIMRNLPRMMKRLEKAAYSVLK